MKDDASTREPRPTTLPEESSAHPRFEAAKSRVASFLTSFTRKKKATPENAPASQDGPVRPALFLDTKGKIVAAQPGCVALFGRQPDELVGLSIKDLLKPGFDREITNLLAKGKEANELSFHVLVLRKDGSEFTTKFSFKLLQDFRFRWAVFVQAPADSNGGADQPANEPKAIIPTTETATTETPERASGRPVDNEDVEDQDEIENRNLSGSDAKARAELNKERETIKVSRKKEEVFQTQVQTLQGALEQAEARAHEGAPQSKDWEKKAANLKKCVDELTRRHAAEQNAAIKAAQRVRELEEQLKRTGDDKAAGKKATEDQNDTRHRLKAENRNLIEANAKAKADLDKERDAIKVSLKKEEELQTQVQKLQGAFEIAEAHARESAAQSKDWEKKAAELKKSADELTRRHAAEQNAAVKAAQRVKELEEQLERAGDDQASGKKDIGDQDDTRHRLKAENRNLVEANATAKADLDKERNAVKVFLKKEEELQAQLQKLQGALEQTEARSRESTSQFKDWEKKTADLKRSVDEITRRHASEQNAAIKASQRVKELEEQLKRAGDDQASGKKAIENQGATRQRLEAENRNLTEANAKTREDLDKERDASKASRKKEQEFQAQVQKLQGGLEQAEVHARESAAQSKDWEKKAAALKKSVDELTKSNAAEQSAAAERVTELEQQLKRAGDDLAASKAENRNLTETMEKHAAPAKRAAAEIEKLEEKLKRQVELERASQSKIAELEKTIQDRGDELARASAALQKEVKEREIAQEQSRLVSEMSKRLESSLASFEDAKRAFEVSLNEKDRRLQIVERSLAETNSDLEQESSERRRAEGLLADAEQQLEKLSGEIFTKASGMYSDGLYSDSNELMNELVGTLDEKTSIFNNAWNLHAHTLTKLGRFEEAKRVVQQRIKEIEDRLGKKHPSLMCPLNNLAAILERTGFVFEAEQVKRRVLSIVENCSNVDDFEFGTYLNKLSKRAGTKRPNAV